MANIIADHKRGTTFDGISFTFEEEQTNGTFLPMNLTGFRIDIDFLVNKNGTPVFSFSTANSTISVSNSVVTMLPRLITVPENRYMFDIKFTNPNGEITEPVANYWNII